MNELAYEVVLSGTGRVRLVDGIDGRRPAQTRARPRGRPRFLIGLEARPSRPSDGASGSASPWRTTMGTLRTRVVRMVLQPRASCTLSDRGKNVAPVLKRGFAAEPAPARASGEEQERRLRVLLLDEGSIATTGKAEGCRWGRSTHPARSISTLCRDAEVPRCWSLGIACGCESPLTRSSSHCPVTQTHQPTASTKKTCKCRPFRERLKGFEPSTFCMASRAWGSRWRRDFPANERVPARGALCDSAAFTAKSREFGHRMGTRGSV
jgi:hypothetical protein